jgi:6-pyruvoyltetrahydropterin/6-carboxytetrahydropterin synthase
MHKLTRFVRFSINPFLPEDIAGFNSFAGQPAGQGLAIFFELGVGVVGQVSGSTGFVVNVTDIDKSVRSYVVPIFAERIREDFRQGKHIGFCRITELLKASHGGLIDKFEKAMVSELILKLNPFRKIAVDCEDWKMIYFSEKFEFAAMHKLWNDEFSQQRNLEVFGKCANPSGHGHNYIIEVTVKMPTGKEEFCAGDFERSVDEEFITLVDHKNLNADVGYFAKSIPTVENIAVFAWDRLVDNLADSRLHCVTVWETDKTCCSYYG